MSTPTTSPPRAQETARDLGERLAEEYHHGGGGTRLATLICRAIERRDAETRRAAMEKCCQIIATAGARSVTVAELQADIRAAASADSRREREEDAPDHAAVCRARNKHELYQRGDGTTVCRQCGKEYGVARPSASSPRSGETDK